MNKKHRMPKHNKRGRELPERNTKNLNEALITDIGRDDEDLGGDDKDEGESSSSWGRHAPLRGEHSSD